MAARRLSAGWHQICGSRACSLVGGRFSTQVEPSPLGLNIDSLLSYPPASCTVCSTQQTHGLNHSSFAPIASIGHGFASVLTLTSFRCVLLLAALWATYLFPGAGSRNSTCDSAQVATIVRLRQWGDGSDHDDRTGAHLVGRGLFRTEPTAPFVCQGRRTGLGVFGVGQCTKNPCIPRSESMRPSSSSQSSQSPSTSASPSDSEFPTPSSSASSVLAPSATFSPNKSISTWM